MSQSTKVTPFDGDVDQFGHLLSAVGTPEANKKYLRIKKKKKKVEKANMKMNKKMAMNYTMLQCFSWYKKVEGNYYLRTSNF